MEPSHHQAKRQKALIKPNIHFLFFIPGARITIKLHSLGQTPLPLTQYTTYICEFTGQPTASTPSSNNVHPTPILN